MCTIAVNNFVSFFYLLYFKTMFCWLDPSGSQSFIYIVTEFASRKIVTCELDPARGKYAIRC